jgi:hypothetical protein
VPTTKKSLITISKDEALAVRANAARAQTISKDYEERLNVCAMLSAALEEGGKHFAVNRKKYRNTAEGDARTTVGRMFKSARRFITKFGKGADGAGKGLNAYKLAYRHSRREASERYGISDTLSLYQAFDACLFALCQHMGEEMLLPEVTGGTAIDDGRNFIRLSPEAADIYNMAEQILDCLVVIRDVPDQHAGPATDSYVKFELYESIDPVEILGSAHTHWKRAAGRKIEGEDNEYEGEPALNIEFADETAIGGEVVNS